MNHVFRRSLTRCLKTKKKKRKTGRKRFIHVTPVLTRIDTIYTAGIARSIQPRPGVDITFQTCNLSSFKTQNTDIRLPRSGLHYSTSPLNKALTVPRELRPLIQRVPRLEKNGGESANSTCPGSRMSLYGGGKTFCTPCGPYLYHLLRFVGHLACR